MFDLATIESPQVIAEQIITVSFAIITIVGIQKGLIGRKAIRARVLREQAEAKAKSESTETVTA